MERLAFVLILTLTSLTLPARAESDPDYVEARKYFVESDEGYMEYLSLKKQYADDSNAGLAEYRRMKSWREWRNEKIRERFVDARDKHDRLPASIQDFEEREYEKEHAISLQEIERDKEEHLRFRDMREKARRDVFTHPMTEAIRVRNHEPWNE